MVCFTVKGLMDELTAVESTVTEQPLPQEEYALQLEVMMADEPGWPLPTTLLMEHGDDPAHVEE